jgi:fatty-acyl-CoA synthase
MSDLRWSVHPSHGPYAEGLDRNDANHAPLTPLSFLMRTAAVYPNRVAVVHGRQRHTYAELLSCCRLLASALERRGIRPGDTVAAMLPNIPAMLEAHHGVPMCGAILNALNTRLDAAALAFILQHGEAKALLTDTEFAPVMREAVRLSGRRLLVIDVDDREGPGGERIGAVEYEELLAEGDPSYRPLFPADEWQAIALNYTSGTTGNPKGVVYHHRGAHLNARRRDNRRDHDARPRRHEGLPEEPDRHRRGVRRRLVPHRRPRRHALRRLCRDQGPLQRHHHLRRREYQLDRGRGRALLPSRRAGGRGGRPA